MPFQIPPSLSQEFVRRPETGMGYQLVRVNSNGSGRNHDIRYVVFNAQWAISSHDDWLPLDNELDAFLEYAARLAHPRTVRTASRRLDFASTSPTPSRTSPSRPTAPTAPSPSRAKTLFASPHSATTGGFLAAAPSRQAPTSPPARRGQRGNWPQRRSSLRPSKSGAGHLSLRHLH